MTRFFQYHPFNLKKLIKSMEQTDELVKFMDYENKLFAGVVAPMLIIAAITNIPAGIGWNKSPATIVLFFVSFFLFAIGIYVGADLRASYKMRVHLVSGLVLLAVITTIALYYREMTSLLWFILFILTLISSFKVDKTLLTYTSISYPIIFVDTVANTYRTGDFFFLVASLILIGMLIVTSFIVNALYRNVLFRKFERSRLLQLQKEQLNLYNSEMRKSQERLLFLSHSDMLTELPNRKMFMEQLSLLIDLNKESPFPFMVAVIDLDNS